MYSFDITAEQKMLVETVHRFAEKEMRPISREAEEQKVIPQRVLRMGWELGLLPGSIEPAYGGFGDYSAVTSTLFLEELGWGDVAITLRLLAPNLFALPIALWGTPEQKAAYLPDFCDEAIANATAAIIEPLYQFDPANLTTTAEKADGAYLLNGRKTFVPLAATATQMLIYARENNLTQAFLVSTDTPGVQVGARVQLMGIKALDLYEVTLEQVRIPLTNRLGGSKGIRLSRLLAVSRIGLAALAVGQARAAYEYALAYAKERTAFGEPIAHRQSIAFMLANMRIEIEATRLMAQEAAYRFDQGEDAGKAALLAKNYADKMVLEVTDSAVQILGGHGYVRDHPVELWLRNGRGFATWDGLLLA